MQHVRCASLGLALSVAVSSLTAQTGAKLNVYGNPQTLRPTSTSSSIDEKDLKTRLYQFADDSMMGRQIGRVGNYKGTTYIANEVKRLGLQPGGVNGTYFQILPYHVRKFTSSSRLTVDGNPLTWNDEWLASPAGLSRVPAGIRAADVVFGGVTGDTAAQISAAQANGKVVVLLPAPPRAPGAAGAGGGRGAGAGGGRGGPGAGSAVNRFAGAVAIITVDLDCLLYTSDAADE